MTETILASAYDAQIHLVYDLLEEGANVLALAGAERRQQMFDFLNGYLVAGATVSDLKGFLNTSPAFVSSDPPRLVSGVVTSDGTSVFPLMEGAGSVRSYVAEAVQELSAFIAANSPVIPAESLGDDYTCKKWVWDSRLDRWVWEYNYTLVDLNGVRLDGSEISRQFIVELMASANPPSQGELWLLQKIKPTYRLVCSVSREEPATA